jgi:hypothetical protein
LPARSIFDLAAAAALVSAINSPASGFECNDSQGTAFGEPFHALQAASVDLTKRQHVNKCFRTVCGDEPLHISVVAPNCFKDASLGGVNTHLRQKD